MNHPGPKKCEPVDCPPWGRRDLRQAGDHLVIFHGSKAVRVYRFIDDAVCIGRGLAADIRIDDEQISREHLRVARVDEGTFRVEDLDSCNGTFVNGERLRGSCELHPGDRVSFGVQTVLHVLRRAAPAIRCQRSAA